eukprot:GILJ01005812.1.p1 GENE.GILJ01005812.1~~GILJ01005812.1.p1  ORF type:complete len:666 (+),score=73.32 GILJ01005812.1:1384-3381(+)
MFLVRSLPRTVRRLNVRSEIFRSLQSGQVALAQKLHSTTKFSIGASLASCESAKTSRSFSTTFEPVVKTPEAAAAKPLTVEEFEQLLPFNNDGTMKEFPNQKLWQFKGPPKIAVAVSGGPDSMALTLLANEWIQKVNKELRFSDNRLVAVTVDHQLRPESAKEAAIVSEWMKARDIDHHVLKMEWAGSPSPSKKAMLAREARMSLLVDFCSQHNIHHLLLGHHLEDQVETFLFRLFRCSGIDGLSGISTISRQPRDVLFLRPFLPLRKDRLVATVASYTQQYVEDRSNADLSGDRVRIRTALKSFSETFPLSDINDIADLMKDYRDAIWESGNRFLARNYHFVPQHGYGILRLDDFGKLASREAQVRSLMRIIMNVSGGSKPPRQRAVIKLLETLTAPVLKSETLGGVQFLPAANPNKVYVIRESAYIEEVVVDMPAGTDTKSVWWDGRFLVTFNRPQTSTTKRALRYVISTITENDWAQLMSKGQHQLRLINVPHEIRFTVPAIYDEHGLYAIPAFNFYRGTMIPFRLRQPLKPQSPASSQSQSESQSTDPSTVTSPPKDTSKLPVLVTLQSMPRHPPYMPVPSYAVGGKEYQSEINANPLLAIPDLPNHAKRRHEYAMRQREIRANRKAGFTSDRQAFEKENKIRNSGRRRPEMESEEGDSMW